ncbi:unnamed protein product [Clavelina lepadiformis]|uniref:CRAL-TRIO domain-containing protein n=2 Tax=Clavelina lepadiformis TaxID=159417 RepID=A0ABP0FKW2_CLALP
MAVINETGSFRRLSLSDEETLTVKDHGPIAGNNKLPVHTVKKAAKELNETEENKQREIAELRSLIDERAKLVSDEEKEEADRVVTTFRAKPDDVMVKFLRARKYDAERAYDLMRGYVGYRLKYPEVVSSITQKEVRHSMEIGQPGVLPSRDAKGRVVMFFRFETWDPLLRPFTEIMQSFVYILEKLLESCETQINGVCIIEDFSGYTFAQVAAVSIAEYKQMIDMLQGSFPCRFKGIHCIRQPWYFAKAFSFIKPYLRAKLFERVHVYGEELEVFFNEFSRDFLPSDFGGTAPPYDGVAAANALFGPNENDSDEDTSL